MGGPLLYGQSGGALGSATGSSKNLALTWLSSGNVGIGVAAPTARLDVAGSVNVSGLVTLAPAASVTAERFKIAGALSAITYVGSGPLRAGALQASSLVIKPDTENATEVGSINTAGSINTTNGGDINGTVANPLNITSVGGTITVHTLKVNNTLNPPGSGGDPTKVRSAQKRIIIGEGTLVQKWADSTVGSTPGVPMDGEHGTTGMRLVLAGASANANLVGFGLASSTELFSTAPGGGVTTWYGGTSPVLTLNSDTGLLATTGQLQVGAAWSIANPVLHLQGSVSSRLLLNAPTPFPANASPDPNNRLPTLPPLPKRVAIEDEPIDSNPIVRSAKLNPVYPTISWGPREFPASNPDTQQLSFSNSSDGKASLSWFNSTTNVEIPILSFKHTKADDVIKQKVPNLGYVGINTPNPRAPLHVTQSTAFADLRTTTQKEDPQPWSEKTEFNTATSVTDILPGPADTANKWRWGVFLSGNGGVIGGLGASAVEGNNGTQRYEHIAAILEGETISNRSWFGYNSPTASDARAKHILGHSDPAKDLATLMKVEVTDYHWIDRSLDGHRPHKRLIAQQVQSVFPQAVSIAPLPMAIPSVYEMATSLRHDPFTKTLAITTKKPHGFKAGDHVDLLGETDELKDSKVNAVSDAHTFAVTSATAPKSLFVYGKYVRDFRTVDYDAVSMLNLSATQAIKKHHDELAAENLKLKQQVTDLEKRRNSLEEARAKTNAKFAALEALLNRKAAPSATTASIRK